MSGVTIAAGVGAVALVGGMTAFILYRRKKAASPTRDAEFLAADMDE